MAKQTPHKSVMLRLNPEVYEQISAVAKAEKRSVTAQVELVLERFLEHVADGVNPNDVIPKESPVAA